MTEIFLTNLTFKSLVVESISHEINVLRVFFQWRLKEYRCRRVYCAPFSGGTLFHKRP